MKTTFKLFLALALFACVPFVTGCTGDGSVEPEEGAEIDEGDYEQMMEQAEAEESADADTAQ